ncbi:IS66 family insertion sequence element accessory protein TnpB [Pseudomonas defluvii]|uniref:IS66 family insertion sequence element accessory protein TnpB n=1 Tax=Pseudomonas defluvii TaxID=1876757 RepID=UPI000AE3B2B5|nr:IS66 family insertion sequence element accessory protein TnpB [Pseudomonas defluvii]
MRRPDAKVEKVYLYPRPVDFRKSIDGLAALVELDIKVAVFDPVLFVLFVFLGLMPVCIFSLEYQLEYCDTYSYPANKQQ